MYRYSITIPEPSADRLNYKRTLIVRDYEGFSGGMTERRWPISDGVTEITFETASKLDLGVQVLDAPSSHTSVRFENSTGSRHEELPVIPTLVSDNRTDAKHIGQIAYEAFRGDSTDYPPWEELSPECQEANRRAAQAVSDFTRGRFLPHTAEGYVEHG